MVWQDIFVRGLIEHPFSPFMLRVFYILFFLHGIAACKCAAQEYVDICDCAKGVKGVCIEYLDSNWRVVPRTKAVWYYYNYSFGKDLFFDWSWRKGFVKRNYLMASDTTKPVAGSPAALNGKYYWTNKKSNEVAVEQTFRQGWPDGQTKAFSKKGYLLESLDFDSPYNRGRFSMMCHLYHKGKLDMQCVFALDPERNKSYALDIPWKVNEPPSLLSITPLFQRSLVLDIQGLQHSYISAENTPAIFHLISEGCYAPQAAALNYYSDKAKSILDICKEAQGWRSNQIYAHRTMIDEIENADAQADVFYEDSEYEIMKMCKSTLRNNQVRHILVALDTLQIALDLYSDTSRQFSEALRYVDRCTADLMQFMRLSPRELDWNCVLITSSTSPAGTVPWLLWGKHIRSNYLMEQDVTVEKSFYTFAHFARLDQARQSSGFVMSECNFSKFKRDQ
jgi:hypothetical protein